MSREDYIAVRPDYLEKERAFRRAVGVILKKPVPYSTVHEEIWLDEDDEIWDAEREFNIDEVPFYLDMKTRQIIAIGERPSVTRKNLKYQGKYRNGTLVIISNLKRIYLIVIIYPKGGKGVAKKLQDMVGGSCGARVLWECSQSGSMTREIWEKTMNLFKNMTKVLRGCVEQTTLDWQKAVVLDFDNYGVHLNKEIATRYASLYGIFFRCLLRNASHLQQPIDQHIGVFIKDIIKKKLEKWVITNNRFCSFGQTLLFDKQKWRELTARFVLEALEEIESKENVHVLALAWQNYGLFLKLDGSQDGDIKTLHLDAANRPTEWRQKRTQAFIDRVTIRKRDHPFQWRAWPPLHVNYSIDVANENSRIDRLGDTPQVAMLKNDLSQSNVHKLKKFTTDFNQDLTNLSNILPDFEQIVGPYDVIALKKLYLHHGNMAMLDNIFLTELLIPTRDQCARITAAPLQGMSIIYIYILVDHIYISRSYIY